MTLPMTTRARAKFTASWIGKAAHEIGLLTGFDGRRCYLNAQSMAEILQRQGDDIRDVDPLAYAEQFFGERWARRQKAA